VSAVEWTDAERDPAALTESVRDLFAWAMSQGPGEVDEGEARVAFDRWLRAMLDQARGEGQERVGELVDAMSACPQRREGHYACDCPTSAEAERDRLAETLRLRSEALDRVVTRAEAAEGVLGRVWALHRPVYVRGIRGTSLEPFIRCSCTPGLLFSECPTAAALEGAVDG